MSTVSNSDIQNLVTQVEKDLLDHIIEGLKKKEIPLPEAQKTAKDFLSQLPFEDKKDLLEKLKKISRIHPDALDVYFKYANDHEEDEREKKLHLASQHIKNGDVESALNAVKESGQNG